AAVDVLTTFSVFAVALALSLRGTPVGSLFIAWLMIIVAEIAQRLPQFRVPCAVPLPLTTLPTQPTASETCDEEIAEPDIPPGLMQQLTRVLEDGRESIHVLVKANIAADDRLA